MRFHVLISRFDIDAVLELAPLIEEAGLAGLSIGDHLITPHPLPASYPYSADGTPPYTSTMPWPDVWVLIGALSRVTTRLEFLSNIFILPLRHPIIVARAAGTAATLAGGRVSVGVGVGWLEEEFRAVGADFARRGSVTDESIAALRGLWSGGVTEFHGQHIDFGPVSLEPPPPGPIPILVGGKTEVALRRAAMLADGYLGTQSDPTEFATTIARVRELRRDSPMADRPFAIHGMAAGARTLDDYRRLAELGVDTYTIVPATDPASPISAVMDEIKRFADEIAEPLRDDGSGSRP